MKKPLSCKLGMHQRLYDSALVHTAMRCDRCDWVENQEDARKLDLERQMFQHDDHLKSLDMFEARVYIMKNIGKE